MPPVGQKRTSGIGADTAFSHAMPPEAASKDAYIDGLRADMLPALAAAGLVDAVDAFCETIAFSPEQCGRLFDAARALGLPVKLHADQLSNGGGARLAAKHGALSADHLEYTDEAGAVAMGGRPVRAALALFGVLWTKLQDFEAFS